MYCKDCKHWVRSSKPNSLGGRCYSDDIKEDDGEEFSENQLIYSYNEGGVFKTGAKFGCVNFKEKSE